MLPMFAIERDQNTVDIIGRVSSSPTTEGDFTRLVIKSEISLIAGRLDSIDTTVETKDPRLITILNKVRLGDMVIVNGPISVSKNVLASKITNLGNIDKNYTVLLGTVKAEPIVVNETMTFLLETKEPGRNRFFITPHTIESTDERIQDIMRTLKRKDKVLVHGLFCNKRIIATNLVPVSG